MAIVDIPVLPRIRQICIAVNIGPINNGALL